MYCEISQSVDKFPWFANLTTHDRPNNAVFAYNIERCKPCGNDL